MKLLHCDREEHNHASNGAQGGRQMSLDGVCYSPSRHRYCLLLILCILFVFWLCLRAGTAEVEVPPRRRNVVALFQNAWFGPVLGYSVASWSQMDKRHHPVCSRTPGQMCFLVIIAFLHSFFHILRLLLCNDSALRCFDPLFSVVIWHKILTKVVCGHLKTVISRIADGEQTVVHLLPTPQELGAFICCPEEVWLCTHL